MRGDNPLDSGSTLTLIVLVGSTIGFLWLIAADTALPLLRRSQIRDSLSEGGMLDAAIRRLRSERARYEDSIWLLTLTSAAAIAALFLGLLLRETDFGWLLLIVNLGIVWLLLMLVVPLVGGLTERLSNSKLLILGMSVQLGVWPFLILGRLAHARPVISGSEGNLSVQEGFLEPVEADLQVEEELADEPLEKHERAMIHNILQLDETPVREIMVPRVDVIALDIVTSFDDAASKMLESGHSRLPVYEDSADNMVGILYGRDLLAVSARGEAPSKQGLESLLRPCFFVPESKRVDEMLTEFQQRRVHLAIVVDEYGGVAGLVTVEDVLEEIVGELTDEFDVDEPTIEWSDGGTAVIDARLPVDEFNERFGASIIPEGFDTAGGFIYARLGKVPASGDEVLEGDLRVEVLSTVGRRVQKLRVTKVSPSSDSDTDVEI